MIDPGSEGLEDRDDIDVQSYRVTVRHGLSDPVVLNLDDDGIGSMLIEVRGVNNGQYGLATFVDPSGEDLIESGKFQTRDARDVPGYVEWLYPNRPDIDFKAGKYLLKISAFDGNRNNIDDDVTVQVVTKQRSDFGCRLGVEMRIDKDAFSGLENGDLMQDLLHRVSNIYAQTGIKLQFGLQDIVLPDSDVSLATRQDKLDTLSETSTALSDAQAGTVHMMVIHSIVLNTTDPSKGDPTGYSLGLPGPVDGNRPNAAVLVGVKDYTESGSIDIAGLATTCSHEMGHFLGLYHTSESSMTKFDPIPDTPQCDGSSCGDSTNIMYYTGGASRSIITPGQATVLRRHPLCAPVAGMDPQPCGCTSGALCSTVGGQVGCRPSCRGSEGQACDDSTTCQRDDNNVLVCY
jgi:hypothetical protein